MADLPPWPDPHDLLAELLADLTVTDVVGPLLYAEFQDDMPLIRVRKVGGTNDKITDFPRMAVDVYTATYAESYELAEAIRQRLMSYPHITASAGRLDRCEVETSPYEVPWPDPSTRYLTATYRISTRR
ncbi:MAG TPA: DUF3168 domain-containing protein [Pseudonocardia sp.]|uniref:DUF3168 domain-containing protein n=1 Tax=Pseudonocardia sp. TaxID=60912 RepID=UPI002CEAF9BE|nr:DUF3168 domain-containing protein [Pseudonocardia sp.]HTF53593.1 DUF3168 domain-containing protein [Pseudonocardia sp.]